MKKIYLTALLLFSVVFITVGCANNPWRNTTGSEGSIEIKITNTSELENETYYTLDVTNNSERTIKYIELEFGYGLTEKAKKEGILTEVMFSAKAQNKPYDIKSGRSEQFKARIPVAILKEDKINEKDIIISVVGYYDELKVENRFMKSGNLSYFITDYK